MFPRKISKNMNRCSTLKCQTKQNYKSINIDETAFSDFAKLFGPKTETDGFFGYVILMIKIA